MSAASLLLEGVSRIPLQALNSLEQFDIFNNNNCSKFNAINPISQTLFFIAHNVVSQIAHNMNVKEFKIRYYII